ncbi:hypothetical protein ACWGI9_42680 [Streptomyces sp. NPDC054833]
MAVLAAAERAKPYIEVAYIDAVHERRRHPLLDCVTVRLGDVPSREAHALEEIRMSTII